MRRLFVVIGLLCSILLVDSEPGGGLRLRISKFGLNKVVDYLLENNLIPFLRAYDGGELSLADDLLDLTILVNKLKFESLQGEHAEIILKGNNVVEIVAGFQSLQLSANITIVYADSDNEYGPDSFITFSDSRLEVTISLGTSNNSASVDLQKCKAKFGKITAEGQLKDSINGILAFAGGKAAEIIEQFCPYLEDLANRYLGNILDLQKNTTVVLPSGQVGLTFQTTSVGADENYIHVTTAVTFVGDGGTSFGSDDVNFPDNDLPGDNKDLDISMNLFLLNQLLHKGLNTTAVLLTTLEKENGFPDDIDTLVSTFADQADVTTNGVSLDGSTNISFLDHTNQSKLFQTAFNGVIPITLSSSERELLAVPDTERTQLFFKITDEKLDSFSAADMKELQWKILRVYQNKIDTLLKEYSVQLALPNTDLYGFKDTLLHTSEDLLSVSADLRVGQSPPDTHQTVSHHDKYSDRKLEVIFLDGETRTDKTDVTAGTSDSVPCLTTLVTSIALLILITKR